MLTIEPTGAVPGDTMTISSIKFGRLCVVLSTVECEQLAAIAADRNRPRKHAERARIVLASADRHSAQWLAQSVGVSRPTVWRWQ
jgi:hypothetical protein